MGVPKFVPWLTKKYPDILSRTCPDLVHGLYIDLNGLIHPCCHDDDDPSVALRSESEKIRRICLEVEVLVATTRPGHLIYIATDGVAPRAKMNQQRARRYMSVASCESHIAPTLTDDDVLPPEDIKTAERDIRLTQELLQMDSFYAVPSSASPRRTPKEAAAIAADMLGFSEDEKGISETTPISSHRGDASFDADTLPVTPAFDSNCISPATAFMMKVSTAMRQYVEERIRSDDALWRHLQVVLSDANVPMEGEQKLIDFIRTQSSYGGMSGHGAHVIAGLDTDLVFLALSLHLPQVYLLRDKRQPSSYKNSKRRKSPVKSSQSATFPLDDAHATVTSDQVPGTLGEADASRVVEVPTCSGMQAGVEEHVLSGLGHHADSCERPLLPAGVPCASDEIGNDVQFASVGPNLRYEYMDIDRLGASLVSEVYRLWELKECEWLGGEPSPDTFVAASGYTCSGEPQGGSGGQRRGQQSVVHFHPCTASCNAKVVDDIIVLATLLGNDFIPRLPSAFSGEYAMDHLLEVYVGSVLPHGYLTAGHNELDLRQLRRLFTAYSKTEMTLFRQFCVAERMTSSTEAFVPFGSNVDCVWRDAYYQSTSVSSDRLQDACCKYVEGMRFVWRYYSCTSLEVSWSWYYPYHHGPLAMDVAEYLSHYDDPTQQPLPPPKLEAVPPTPLVQLLSILPPTSRNLVPSVFHRYMLDPPEDLQDTFPTRWQVDLAGAYEKTYLAAVLIPFADAELIERLVATNEHTLTSAERQRYTNSEFHIVLQRRRGDVTEAEQPERFVIHGEVATLTPAMSQWPLADGLSYRALKDSPPRLSKPRTYSVDVPIPLLDAPGYGRRGRVRRRGKSACHSTSATASAIPNHSQPVTTVTTETPSLAEFMIASAAFFTLAVGACGSFPCSLLIVVQLVSIFVGAITLAFFMGFAMPATGGIRGCGIRRNVPSGVNVDWQCQICMALNFARNLNCYICRCPYDRHQSVALFSRRTPSQPPVLDPNHTPYCQWYSFPNNWRSSQS